MILTIDAHPMGVPGVWRIRIGNAVVATLVQPNVAVALKQLPTADEIRDAVREVSPQYAVTEETCVRYAGGTLAEWIAK